MLGLEGVVVAETTLSHIDGEEGRLIVRGATIDDLAGRISFEEMCHLLWKGTLPTEQEREEMSQRLGAAREAAFGSLGVLGDALQNSNGMDALRASLAHLTASDDDFPLVVGAVSVFAAGWWRHSQGEAPLPPDPAASHAADYLRSITGVEPADEVSRALDTYLVTVAEHGLNASTFAARIVASTRSDAISAVVAAVGALKGPLHGGAPGPVADMLDAISQPERARAWLEGELAAGRRIMGMGHRVYRTRDPRAGILEASVDQLAATGRPGRLALARTVEAEARALLRANNPDRVIDTNVEFYTALLLEALQIPRPLFSPTFAAARVAGWLAHVAEQWETGRMIRPTSRYVGEIPLGSTVET